MSVRAAAKGLWDYERDRLWSWAAVLCLVLFVGVVRFRLRDMPLERDEGEYAYAGQLLLQGNWPGEGVYTMKLPGTHAAYALLIAVFGQTCAGVHIGFLAANCVTLVFMYLLARALTGEWGGVIAAASYGVMTLNSSVLGTSAHATHFVLLLAVPGLWLLWRAAKQPGLISYFGSGALLGGSVLMKHNGVCFVAFGVGWLGWLAWSKHGESSKAMMKAAVVYLGGVIAPLTVLALLLWLGGTLKNYWFWAVTYAGAYARPYPGLNIFWDLLMERMPGVLKLPFYLAPAGLAAMWFRRSAFDAPLFATGWLLSSVAAVVPGFHFRPHYYVLMTPVLALLAGGLVQRASELLNRRIHRLVAWLPAAAAAVIMAQAVARDAKFLFQTNPTEACRLLYGFQPFPEARVVGEYLREHAAPGARIAVLGSEPEIYFYAHRRSATGFIYTYALREPQPFAQRMWRQMREEIEAAQPEFMVQVRTWGSWQARPAMTQRIGEFCAALTPPHYQLIGLCNMYPEQPRVEWHWQPEPTIIREATQLVLLRREGGY
jgi:hypothetical protein